MRYLLFLFVALAMVSCSKEEQLGAPDSERVSPGEFVIKSIMEDPFSVKVDKGFYVQKESNAFSSAGTKVTYAGLDKTKKTISYSVNDVKVPQTKKGTFYNYIGSADSEGFINEQYAINADGHEVVMNDVGVKLKPVEADYISAGSVIGWGASGVEDNPIVVAIRQNSITTKNEIVAKPTMTYELVHGNKIEVTEQMLKNFTKGMEVTVTVGAINSSIERGTAFATLAINHSKTFKIIK